MLSCAGCGVSNVPLKWIPNEQRAICRACHEKAQLAERDARRAKQVGQQKWWTQMDRVGRGTRVSVVIEGARGGWIVVRDEAGKQHRVREHNLSDRRG